MFTEKEKHQEYMVEKKEKEKEPCTRVAIVELEQKTRCLKKSCGQLVEFSSAKKKSQKTQALSRASKFIHIDRSSH